MIYTDSNRSTPARAPTGNGTGDKCSEDNENEGDDKDTGTSSNNNDRNNTEEQDAPNNENDTECGLGAPGTPEVPPLAGTPVSGGTSMCALLTDPHHTSRRLTHPPHHSSETHCTVFSLLD